MQQKNICGRFAPTPSGRMHLGNIFCAMLSWLSVRSHGGKYILRIEDLDAQRCSKELSDKVEDDLRWFGIDWDEGGSDGGESWYQSSRFDIYKKYFDKLDEQGLIYPCFCTRAELHAAQAPHLSDGTYIYSGACRNLTKEMIEQKSKNRAPAMRLAVPNEVISFTDGCQGEYSQNLAQECGDFIIRRSDGVYGYQLAVVADDALMGVTQVVRGKDLLSSAARQIYIYRKLGFDVPKFYHIPLLTAPDGRRLSKRDKDLDIGVLRKKFSSPEPIIGFLAGACGLRDSFEPVTMKELTYDFSWDKIHKDDIILPDNIL